MSSEFDIDQWDRVSRELRACKETQQQAWGHLDCTTLGRYLAGESTGDETVEVEQALAELPELRKLTDLVRDVLGDLAPVSLDQANEEPRLLTLRSKQPVARSAIPARLVAGKRGWRGTSALVAAACLLLVVTAVLPRGGYFSAPAPEHLDLGRGEASRVPLDRVADRYLAAADNLPAMRNTEAFKVAELAPLLPLAPPGGRGNPTSPLRSTNENGRHWREQLASARPGQVKNEVVPALVRALNKASTPNQRRGVVLALGELGPAAGPALPALTYRLKNSTDTQECEAVLAALDRMGPRARRAVPTLQAIAPGGRQMVASKGGFNKPQLGLGNQKCNEAQLNRVLATLQATEGQAGICDDVGCFKVKTLCETVCKLRTLAKKSKIVVLIETHPACNHHSARLARKRLKEMGSTAVFIVIGKKGPTCRVFASELLRNKGFAAEQLQQALQRKLQRQSLDAALTAGVDLIARHVAAAK